MKIKNLAFCGVMASILGLTGAYAADATIIASKAYVDARDNLKEDVGNKETATYANSTNKTSTTVYPSMATLTDAYTTLNNNITTNVTNNTYSSDFASTTGSATNITVSDVAQADEGKLVKAGNVENSFQAVHDAIANMDHATGTASTNASSAVTAVSQSDGKVTVTNGTLGAAAIGEKSGANQIEESNTTYLTTVGGVQNTIARQGTLEQAWNEDFDESAATTAGATNLYKASTNYIDPETRNPLILMDDFVPTVAAVEKRVQLAESNAQTNSISNHDSNTAFQLADAADKAPSVNTVKRLADTTEKVTRDTSTQALTVATSGATDNTAPTTLTYATDMDTMATAINAKLNKNTAITASTNAMNIVTYDANGLVTGGKILNTTGLNDINRATNSGTTCSASNPCVLTYTGTDYKWTNMDTDSLSAVADTNS